MELTVNDLRTNKQSVKTYYVVITNKDGIRKYISSPKFYKVSARKPMVFRPWDEWR